jgi:hypothetical protein
MSHHGRLDIFRSLNTPKQPNATTNDDQLQSKNLQVIDAIYDQPLPRSKNLGFWVRSMVVRCRFRQLNRQTVRVSAGGTEIPLRPTTSRMSWNNRAGE